MFSCSPPWTRAPVRGIRGRPRLSDQDGASPHKLLDELEQEANRLAKRRPGGNSRVQKDEPAGPLSPEAAEAARLRRREKQFKFDRDIAELASEKRAAKFDHLKTDEHGRIARKEEVRAPESESDGLSTVNRALEAFDSALDRHAGPSYKLRSAEEGEIRSDRPSYKAVMEALKGKVDPSRVTPDNQDAYISRLLSPLHRVPYRDQLKLKCLRNEEFVFELLRASELRFAHCFVPTPALESDKGDGLTMRNRYALIRFLFLSI